MRNRGLRSASGLEYTAVTLSLLAGALLAQHVSDAKMLSSPFCLRAFVKRHILQDVLHIKRVGA